MLRNRRAAAVVLAGIGAIGVVIALMLNLESSPVRLSIVEFTSAPDGRPLTTRRVNVVEVPADMSFKVVLRGGAERRPTVVTLTIAPRSLSLRGIIRRRKLISVERNGVTRVTFANLGAIPFAQLETVRVTLTDVRRHQKLTRRYRVLFALA